MLRRPILLAVLALLLAAFLPAPAAADGYPVVNIRQDANPPNGWVKVVYVIRATWCNTSGQCGTDWAPDPQEAIFERPPDRRNLGHGEGDDTPPFPPVGRWPRLRCVDGKWAAGTWYHNATFSGSWQRVEQYTSWDQKFCTEEHGVSTPCTVKVWRETWTMLRDYSNFAPNDPDCSNPGDGGGGGRTPTPVPTLPPRPTNRPPTRTPTPTPRPVVPLPDPWVSTRTTPPTIEFGYVPPYPVIAHQDVTGLGVTLLFTVTTYPIETVRHWYTCEHPPDQPDMCYLGTIVEHTSVSYTPDPLNPEETHGVMTLTQRSRSWIRNVLKPKFGVDVRHPEWEIPPAPEATWRLSDLLPGYIYQAYGSYTLHPEDPGWYEVDLLATTVAGVQGTFPLPLPRLSVTGFGVTLIR